MCIPEMVASLPSTPVHGCEMLLRYENFSEQLMDLRRRKEDQQPNPIPRDNEEIYGILCENFIKTVYAVGEGGDRAGK